MLHIWGPFAKFVDSPYYSTLELHGDVVTVSFPKYLPWQAMCLTLLENMLQTVDHFKISCLRAPFSWLEKPRICMGRDLNWIVFSLDKVDLWNPIRTSAIIVQPHVISEPFQLWKEVPRQEILKWSTVRSVFLRSGWSDVIIASLAKGGTSKKRPSPHLHKLLTQSNKVSPQIFKTALIKLGHANRYCFNV
jgi:hypothetical protein